MVKLSVTDQLPRVKTPGETLTMVTTLTCDWH